MYETRSGDPITSLSDAEERLVIESVTEAGQRGEDILADTVSLAADHGVDIETALLHGDPITAVPSYAEDNNMDGILVGHRGLSQTHERPLGSVAKAIVDRTTIPVTIVR